MQIDDGGLQLTYCTNIHPAEGWDAVAANVAKFAPALKRVLSPSRPFGIGLRLSAREARELLQEGRLAEFQSFLDGNGLYVALINGFPYGPFHGAPVKADVYAPDWRDPARVDYTLDLIEILRRLLPAGMDGGVSTAPLSYKRWVQGSAADARRTMTAHVLRVAKRLAHIARTEGKLIHLDIEPEPDCLIENSAELIGFFERWLLPAGLPQIQRSLGVTPDEARAILLDHVQVCFDCCHFAVEYEEPADALNAILGAGLRIGRVQLSSALQAAAGKDGASDDRTIEQLRSFADSTYLHQVGERTADGFHIIPDLEDALRECGGSLAREWRIHFHVPLFTAQYGALRGTQAYVREVIRAALDRHFTNHLEIETYTWDVLPAPLKADLMDSIRREYEWVLAQAGAPASAGMAG